MADNTGHRQRVKNRFRGEGLANFHEIHVLELLLFYALPRVDTKPLARLCPVCWRPPARSWSRWRVWVRTFPPS